MKLKNHFSGFQTQTWQTAAPEPHQIRTGNPLIDGRGGRRRLCGSVGRVERDDQSGAV